MIVVRCWWCSGCDVGGANPVDDITVYCWNCDTEVSQTWIARMVDWGPYGAARPDREPAARGGYTA